MRELGEGQSLSVVGVHSLADGERIAVVYAAAHSGIIYNCVERTQKVLQGQFRVCPSEKEVRLMSLDAGHCNDISAIAVSPDKKYIASADRGPESIIVVWDSHDGVRTTRGRLLLDAHSVCTEPHSDDLLTLTLRCGGYGHVQRWNIPCHTLSPSP